MFNILVTIRVFQKFLKHKNINIFWDNTAVVAILTTGKTKDPFVATIVGNILMEAAQLDTFLKFPHKAGSQNRVADFLSRWQKSSSQLKLLKELVPNANWIEVKVFHTTSDKYLTFKFFKMFVFSAFHRVFGTSGFISQ